jgi:hypothetical protein
VAAALSHCFGDIPERSLLANKELERRQAHSEAAPHLRLRSAAKEVTIAAQPSLDSLLTIVDIPVGQIVCHKCNDNPARPRPQGGDMDATVSQQAGAMTLDERIDKMHARDRAGLIAFVALLWFTILFALFNVWPFIAMPAIRVILVVAGTLVLLFNTAAIVAMLRHYTHDKHFIYGLDLKHLDEMRNRRS